MKLVQFHVANSNSVVAVNPDAVCRVGTIESDRTFIRFSDGSSLELVEPYAAVTKALCNDNNEALTGKP